MKIVEFESYKIFVGDNANENNQLVYESGNYDIWLHLEDYPSCHVIIKNKPFEYKDLKNSKLIKNKKLITRGACLCKSNSKYKHEENINIIYTYCKNVILTEKIGEVIVDNVKYITI